MLNDRISLRMSTAKDQGNREDRKMKRAGYQITPDQIGSRYQRIYAVVCLIPEGQVASYGRVASISGVATARMVGYAMAALPYGSDVPWHRVINSKGRISPRTGGDGDLIQRAMLEEEGVLFDEEGRVDMDRYGWDGFLL